MLRGDYTNINDARFVGQPDLIVVVAPQAGPTTTSTYNTLQAGLDHIRGSSGSAILVLTDFETVANKLANHYNVPVRQVQSGQKLELGYQLDTIIGAQLQTFQLAAFGIAYEVYVPPTNPATQEWLNQTSPR